MKRLACAVAVLSLSMVGCGGSLCDDIADTGKDLNDKLKDCPTFAGITFEEPTESEIKQCEESLDSCSDNDKKTLETFIDCASKLDKCTPATEQAFATSFAACALPLENVSETCGSTGSSLPRKVEALLSSHR